jgi:UDP-N-acetylmuramyl-tripeptide synthetase
VSPHEMIAALGVPVTHLSSDSRHLHAGSTFVAYPGTLSDGRDHIDSAILAGATSVLFEARGWNGRALSVPSLGVENLRRHFAAIADDVYGLPSAQLEMIGVTGTNGKTSTSMWIAEALSALGSPCGVIGTLGAGSPAQLVETKNTTPDAGVLVAHLRGFVQAGMKAAVMEVSSHALHQDRVRGLQWDSAVFTNLTRDHLDYHGSMEAYQLAKARLFEMPTLKHAIVNADDPAADAMVVNTPAKIVRYGLSAGDVRVEQLTMNRGGMTLQLKTPWGAVHAQAGVTGRFNASNLAAVVSVLGVRGFSPSEIGSAVAGLKPVRGRMEMLSPSPGKPLVVVDYAHTPDALAQALTTLREVSTTGGKLIVVFGCGGDRDAGKRPLMGATAVRLADAVWLTSDNPRSEDPDVIIANIASGMSAAKPSSLHRMASRADAIHAAIRAARPEDTVLIAGKGHETYQEVMGARTPFDDVAVAREALC